VVHKDGKLAEMPAQRRIFRLTDLQMSRRPCSVTSTVSTLSPGSPRARRSQRGHLSRPITESFWEIFRSAQYSSSRRASSIVDPGCGPLHSRRRWSIHSARSLAGSSRNKLANIVNAPGSPLLRTSRHNRARRCGRSPPRSTAGRRQAGCRPQSPPSHVRASVRRRSPTARASRGTRTGRPPRQSAVRIYRSRRDIYRCLSCARSGS
jgi:hypothetical protein